MSTRTHPLVAVVGSINMDYSVRVDTLPRPGQTVLGGHLTRGLGGKGANQAAAVAQLLGISRMVGAVGTDHDGDWLLERLAAFGVDVSHVQRDADNASGVALIGVDGHGENSIMVAPGANADVRPSPAATTGADAVMLQFEIPLDTVARVATEFQGFIAVNPSPSHPLPNVLLDNADLLVVNEDEYRELPELERAPLVAITLGSAGAELRRHGELVHKAAAVSVAHAANTVGAGDAFFAALTCALLYGAAEQDALTVACGVAAAAVEDPSSQPRLSPLEAYLARFGV